MHSKCGSRMACAPHPYTWSFTLFSVLPTPFYIQCKYILSLYIKVFFFCTCFLNRISSDAAPVPMPIPSRHFFRFLIFDHFVQLCFFFTFLVLMRVDQLITRGLGQEVPLPLGAPPPIFAHLLRHQFVTFCETLKLTGRVFFELYRFPLRHFLTGFRSQVLNVLKFFKNRVAKQIANKYNHNRINTFSTKPSFWFSKFWNFDFLKFIFLE